MAERPRNPYGRYEPREIKPGRWRVQVPTGGLTKEGNPAYKWVTRATEREARRARDELVAQIRKGATPPSDRLTLAKFLDIWLEATANTVRPRTSQGYRALVDNHLKPGLGRRPLAKLGPVEIGTFYRKLGRTVAPGTVRNVHRVLHQALRWAERKQLLARNVAALADVPTAPEYEARVLSLPETRALLAAARGHRLELLFVLAIYTGMREGELLALRWADLDLDAGVAHVRQSLTRDGGKVIIGETKTKRSRRPVPLVPDLVAGLRNHRQAQAVERLLRPDWEDHDLVFPSRRGTPLTPTNLLRRDYFPLLTRAGLPRVRFHDLRHTVGTHAFRSRPNPKAVSDLLGHAQTSTTMNIYAGTVSEETRAAASDWAAALKDEGRGTGH